MAAIPNVQSDFSADGAERCDVGINRLPFAYLVCDTNLSIRGWNSAAESMLGYSKSEALGKRASELLLPGPMPNDLREKISRIWSGGQSARSVNTNRTKNGRIILCDWFNTPTYDRHGNIDGLIAFGQDVTKRQVAETMLCATQRKFETSFALAPHAIFLVQDTGQFVDANPAACELSGHSREEMLALNTECIAPALHRDAPHANVGQGVITCKDGRAQQMEFAFAPPVIPGGRLLVMRKGSDISDVRQTIQPSEDDAKRLEEQTTSAESVSANEFDLLTIASDYSQLFSKNSLTQTEVRKSAGAAPKLTARQQQVLQFIVEGLKTKQIARELGLSIKTIELHRAQLMKRLGIHDIPGLVRFAIRSGIAPLY